MPLIPPDNDFAMWAVMLLLVALTFRLEKPRGVRKYQDDNDYFFWGDTG